jgi:hypothetical protein
MKISAKNSHLVEAIYLALLVLCLAFMVSCSGQTKTERAVEAEIEQAPAIPPGPALTRAAESIIQESPSLSDEQKQKLIALHQQTNAEIGRLRNELSKVQITLAQNLVDPETKPRAIEILKRRAINLEKKRTDTWLDALGQAEKILGRRKIEDERLYRALLIDPVAPETLR